MPRDQLTPYPTSDFYNPRVIAEKKQIIHPDNKWMYDKITNKKKVKEDDNGCLYIEGTDIDIITVIACIRQVTHPNTFEVMVQSNDKITNFYIQYVGRTSSDDDTKTKYYLHDTLWWDTMSYIPNESGVAYITKINESIRYAYHALNVNINGKVMYAYAMQPMQPLQSPKPLVVISDPPKGGYKKKKTSTKTKTQAKHTFIHGKKTYTRVIHLGKRGGKYVMLNGELVPISKLQKVV
jgi:hypothetical protein